MSGALVYRTLNRADLSEVRAFYAEGIRAIERKEFFLPFTDPDLDELISGGGIAVGAYLDGALAGVSAIDLDEAYGKTLIGHINEFCPHVADNARVCEYSGVMTAPSVRRMGVAGEIFLRLKSHVLAIIPDAVLCAVVQLENIPSLSFFYNRGFRLVSARIVEDIDFGFLINTVTSRLGERTGYDPETVIRVAAKDYPEYRRLIKLGYKGVGCDSSGMLLAQ